MEVKISDWELIQELERRMAKGMICGLEPGSLHLWPRYCPACGGLLCEYEMTVNCEQDALYKMTFDEWRQFTRDMLNKKNLYLPDLPYKQRGTFYFVRCDNSICDYNYCPVVVTKWHRTIEGARLEFFNKASQYV